MKSVLWLLTITFASSLYAVDTKDMPIEEAQDELARVDQLIEATKESLTRLNALKELLVQYKECEMKALKNPNDTDNLLRLINLAKQIQDTIQESAIQDYFSPQFLEELKKFAQISEKKNIPQAK